MTTRASSHSWWLTLLLLNTFLFVITGLPIFSLENGNFYFLGYFAQNFLFACFLSVVLWPILRLRFFYLKIVLAGIAEAIG